MSVNKRKKRKVCMKTNDGERLVRKPEKHIRHLVLNARDLPRHLAFDLALESRSSVGNATSLAFLRHILAFTSIRRLGNAPQGRTLAFKTRWRMCFSGFRTSRSPSFVFMQTFSLFLLLTDKTRTVVKVIYFANLKKISAVYIFPCTLNGNIP